MNQKQYNAEINQLKGKTIAIVYIFEGENASGYKHYDVWRSTVISGWLNAIQEIGCQPFILDARTFMEKASNHSLPHIDYVLNLNCGCEELSTLGLVPSICSFLGIPCLPCTTSGIIVGENKNIANLVAKSLGFNVPKTIDPQEQNGIFRPNNFGSSCGVTRFYDTEKVGIYQEFIPGYDITTPIVYNPISQECEIMPTVIYKPDYNDVTWYLGEKEKEELCGFKRLTLPPVDFSWEKLCLNLATNMDYDTYCRVDARIKCEEESELNNILSSPLKSKDVYFIEINPMPTIEPENNFYVSFKEVDCNNSFYETIAIYNASVTAPTQNGFLLSCAMLSTIAKHKKQKD